MNRGTEIAHICYEYYEDEQKKYRKFGSLFYFRNHSGGTPSAQLRLDMIPAVAWQKNPDTWFIGNFIPSEKVDEAPYVCGQIFVPSDKRGERTYIGHIGTRETNDGARAQFYMQLFGVPIREINKGIKKACLDSARDNCTQMIENGMGFDEDVLALAIEEDLGNKKHSLYLGIELDG